MASKKKKRKKVRKKKAHLDIKKADFPQLINQGKQFLEAGRPRDAISLLKQAIKKGAVADDVNLLLFKAYLLRESQLKQKGMNVEANLVHHQAYTFMPAYDQLSENDLLTFVKSASIENSITTYNKYIMENTRSRVVEQYLAGQFLIHQRWDLVDSLNEAVTLKSDVPTVCQAAEFMESGDWESALASLKPVSRTSPFAPIRMFCLAMVSFYNENDQAMQRALAMIPEEFPLYTLAQKLKQNPSDLPCLWECAINIEKKIADVVSNIKKNRFKNIDYQLKSVGKAIYPEDSVRGIFHLLELIWCFTRNNTICDHKYEHLIKRLLPKNKLDLLIGKIEYFKFKIPLYNTGRYLFCLDEEFPDPADNNIVHALILLHTVEKIRKERIPIPSIKYNIESFKQELGITSDDPDEFLVEMTLKAIRLDPENRHGYELMTSLPRYSRQSKIRVEEALKQMLDFFSDDPYPCLELSTLYYEKNAFRKAENILKEAMKRAPHDNRVIDRHVISLLISADNSIKRKKLHLASRDLEKAAELSGKTTLPLVIEKKILFQIVQQGQLSLFDGKVVSNSKNVRSVIDRAVTPLSPFEKISTLAMLILDVTGGGFEWDKKTLRELDRAYKYFANKIKELPSSHIARLLKPLAKKVQPLVSSKHIARIILERSKNILKHVNDTDIISVLDILIDANLFEPALNDIKRRINKAGRRLKVTLEFYQVVIRHMTHELFMDEKAFGRVLKNVAESDQEPLRAAARRFAAHTSGQLKFALENFDFTFQDVPIIDDMMPLYDLFDDDKNFYEPDDFGGLTELLALLELSSDDIDPSFVKGHLDIIIEQFEHVIDAAGLRGAPDFIIRKTRKDVRKESPDMDNDFSTMATHLDKKGINALSREARMFFFGKD